MRLKMNRRTFLKMTGTAVLAGALAGCGGSGSGNGGGNGGNPGGGDGPENPGGGEEPGTPGGGEDKPGSGKKEKGYYTATAPDTQGVYWTYYYEGSGTEVSLTGYNRYKGVQPRGNVTLPSTLDGLRVTEVAPLSFSWLLKFGYLNDIEDELPNFTKCSFAQVTELTVPTSITWIGIKAFDACVDMGSWTYRVDTSLKKITFLGKTFLASGAFHDNDKLEEIVGVENITCSDPSYAGTCFGNTGFRELHIASNLMYRELFAGCKKLEKVTIQKGVPVIRWGVFSYCDALSKIYIPTSVTSIEERAFYVDYYEEEEVKEKVKLTVYYGGSEAQWKNLMQKTADGNDRLKDAKVLYGQNPDDMK